MKILLRNNKFGYTKFLRGIMAISMGANGFLFILGIFISLFTTELINYQNGSIYINQLARYLDNGIYFLICFFMWLVLNTVLKNHPFENINISRLKKLGFILIGIDVLILLNMFFLPIILNYDSYTFLMEIVSNMVMKPYINTIIGIFAISVGEIINVGNRIKQENELTV